MSRLKFPLFTLCALTFVGGIFADEAFAVRPFVTDDARIADRGQIEGETWFEFFYDDGRVIPYYNALFNVIPLDWLEFGLSGGVGWEADNSVSVVNPGVQTKLLFVRPVDGGMPGFSFVAGTVLPFGIGAGDTDVTGYYLIAPASLALLDGGLEIHANIGWLFASQPEQAVFHRPFWGLGADIGLGDTDFTFVIEAYAGDPVEALGPGLAGQTGFRWIISDKFNLDLSVLLAPAIDEDRQMTGDLEWGLNFGVRFLIDAFTPGGRVGDPEGAPGMFRF